MSGAPPEDLDLDAPASGSTGPPVRATRGRTAPGRLRALDAWRVRAARPLLAAPGAVVVDLGVGAAPWTTLALAEALASAGPEAPPAADARLG